MKSMLVIFAMIALPAHAEIYVCKDTKQKTVYQDEPCTHQTMRVIQRAPAPTPEEQALAQERIDQMNETSRIRAAATELERLEQEKREIELEKIALEKQRIELLEQQALAERYPYPIYINPRYKNRFGGGGRFNNPPYRSPNRPHRNPHTVNPRTVNPTNTIPANIPP